MGVRNTAIPASYLVLLKDNKVLLIRRQGSHYFDGWYAFPAGHVEAGELPIRALIRESKEEIGVDIDVNDVRLVHTMYREAHTGSGGDRADYFFTATKWTGEPKIMEADKCDDMQWFPIDAIPQNSMYYIAIVLNGIKQNQPYSEVHLPQITPNPSA